MSDIKNISLYIPHVFPNFDKEYVAKAFKSIGEVSQIDFVAKQDRNGGYYNAVYVHFKKWYTNKKASDFYDSVVDESKEARLCHDEPWYWIVLPNTAKKHLPGERKPRIDIGESTAISTSNPAHATPVKKVATEIVCPATPMKPSYANSVAKFSWAEHAKKRKDDIVDKVADPEDENAAKIKAITSIILDSEDNLSDGFGYYCGKRGVEKTLGDIAKKILVTLDEPVDDLQPYSSEEAEMMDEIEAELAAEDENLVSVDWRYLKTIEEENMYMHCEIAQLRRALINMDQMYQAEVAKVRAFSATSVDL